jgi:hypothetical protein
MIRDRGPIWGGHSALLFGPGRLLRGGKGAAARYVAARVRSNRYGKRGADAQQRWHRTGPRDGIRPIYGRPCNDLAWRLTLSGQ